jgi:hypothetical protein
MIAIHAKDFRNLQAMIYKKTQKFLVAFRQSDGKFFGLEESFAITQPHYVDHPADAKLISPSPADLLEAKEAPYYFENTARMRHWLKGFKMILVMLTSTAETL